MPNYRYECAACGRGHDEFQSLTAAPLEACPGCQSRSGYGRAFGVPSAIVRGRPKTFGQAAEENARRLGPSGMADLERAETSRLRAGGFTGKLPRGAKINRKGTGAPPPWRDGSFGTPKLAKPLDVRRLKSVKRYIETGKDGDD